uniref:Bestrophin homolog n=1 Tax=Parascaris univalens TaxID=6257 RepID=A0A914ZZ59_PARUN
MLYPWQCREAHLLQMRPEVDCEEVFLQFNSPVCQLRVSAGFRTTMKANNRECLLLVLKDLRCLQKTLLVLLVSLFVYFLFCFFARLIPFQDLHVKKRKFKTRVSRTFLDVGSASAI